MDPRPSERGGPPLKPYRLLAIGALLGIPVTARAQEGEGSFTVFAPTDEAFAKLPVETLNAGNAAVAQADVPATNGVVLAIDTVLLPE